MHMSEPKYSTDKDNRNKFVLRIETSGEMKVSANRVDPSGMGFLAFWRGQIVYENGRVKRFASEAEAYDFLARCDLAGKIIH
jgi:hypothetical protein